MRGLVLGLVIASLAGPALAASSPAPPSGKELRAAVEQLLSGLEPKDPEPGLRRLGASAAAVVLQLAQDTSRPLVRLRAIEALGAVPTASGLALLQRLLDQGRGATDAGAIYDLAAAARALGGAAGLMAPGAAEGALAPLLGHDSADVREGAAAALGKIGTPEAQRALQARLGVEKESGVRAALQQALKR